VKEFSKTFGEVMDTSEVSCVPFTHEVYYGETRDVFSCVEFMFITCDKKINIVNKRQKLKAYNDV